jgi:hypothetical protein
MGPVYGTLGTEKSPSTDVLNWNIDYDRSVCYVAGGTVEDLVHRNKVNLVLRLSAEDHPNRVIVLRKGAVGSIEWSGTPIPSDRLDGFFGELELNLKKARTSMDKALIELEETKQSVPDSSSGLSLTQIQAQEAAQKTYDTYSASVSRWVILRERLEQLKSAGDRIWQAKANAIDAAATSKISGGTPESEVVQWADKQMSELGKPVYRLPVVSPARSRVEIHHRSSSGLPTDTQAWVLSEWTKYRPESPDFLLKANVDAIGEGRKPREMTPEEVQILAKYQKHALKGPRPLHLVAFYWLTVSWNQTHAKVDQVRLSKHLRRPFTRKEGKRPEIRVASPKPTLPDVRDTAENILQGLSLLRQPEVVAPGGGVASFPESLLNDSKVQPVYQWLMEPTKQQCAFRRGPITRKGSQVQVEGLSENAMAFIGLLVEYDTVRQERDYLKGELEKVNTFTPVEKHSGKQPEFKQSPDTTFFRQPAPTKCPHPGECLWIVNPDAPEDAECKCPDCQLELHPGACPCWSDPNAVRAYTFEEYCQWQSQLAENATGEDRDDPDYLAYRAHQEEEARRQLLTPEELAGKRKLDAEVESVVDEEFGRGDDLFGGDSPLVFIEDGLTWFSDPNQCPNPKVSKTFPFGTYYRVYTKEAPKPAVATPQQKKAPKEPPRPATPGPSGTKSASAEPAKADPAVSSEEKKQVKGDGKKQSKAEKAEKDPLNNKDPLKVNPNPPKREKGVPRTKLLTDEELTRLRKVFNLEAPKIVDPAIWNSWTSAERNAYRNSTALPRWAVVSVIDNHNNLALIESGTLTKETMATKKLPPVPSKETPGTSTATCAAAWKVLKEKYPGINVYSNPQTKKEKALKSEYDSLASRFPKNPALPKVRLKNASRGSTVAHVGAGGQDPFSALAPVMTLMGQFAEILGKLR